MYFQCPIMSILTASNHPVYTPSRNAKSIYLGMTQRSMTKPISNLKIVYKSQIVKRNPFRYMEVKYNSNIHRIKHIFLPFSGKVNFSQIWK